jgi:hypothetical protein
MSRTAKDGRREEKRKRRKSGREAEFEGRNRRIRYTAIFGPGGLHVPRYTDCKPYHPITGAAFGVPGSEALFGFFFLVVDN